MKHLIECYLVSEYTEKKMVSSFEVVTDGRLCSPHCPMEVGYVKCSLFDDKIRTTPHSGRLLRCDECLKAFGEG